MMVNGKTNIMKSIPTYQEYILPVYIVLKVSADSRNKSPNFEISTYRGIPWNRSFNQTGKFEVVWISMEFGPSRITKQMNKRIWSILRMYS